VSVIDFFMPSIHSTSGNMGKTCSLTHFGWETCEKTKRSTIHVFKSTRNR